jgi:hypothetical protein
MCQLFVTLLKNNIKRSCLYVDECDVKTNFNITQNNTIIICIIKGYPVPPTPQAGSIFSLIMAPIVYATEDKEKIFR